MFSYLILYASSIYNWNAILAMTKTLCKLISGLYIIFMQVLENELKKINETWNSLYYFVL